MDKITASERSIKFDNTFYDFKSNEWLNPVETENFYIVQAVDSQYFYRHTIGAHKQCCDIELTCILLGKMRCSNDGQEYLLQKKDTHICFNGQIHLLEMKNTCRFQTLAFTVKKSSRYYPLLQRILQVYKNRQKMEKGEKIKALVGEGIAEFYRFDQTLSPLKLDCVVGQLLLCMLRAEGEGEQKPLVSEDTLLMTILCDMDEHFKETVTVFELGKKVGLSYSYLFKIFVARFGVAPKKYLTYKKMEYACELLGKNRVGLDRIAEELQYSSPYNFSRAFKQFVGVSPTAYRAKPFPLENPLEKK